MTEAHLADLCQRVIAMSPEERERLDSVATALMGMGITSPCEVLPNRAIALACVDLLKQWQVHEMERE